MQNIKLTSDDLELTKIKYSMDKKIRFNVIWNEHVNKELSGITCIDMNG